MTQKVYSIRELSRKAQLRAEHFELGELYILDLTSVSIGGFSLSPVVVAYKHEEHAPQQTLTYAAAEKFSNSIPEIGLVGISFKGIPASEMTARVGNWNLLESLGGLPEWFFINPKSALRFYQAGLGAYVAIKSTCDNVSCLKKALGTIKSMTHLDDVSHADMEPNEMCFIRPKETISNEGSITLLAIGKTVIGGVFTEEIALAYVNEPSPKLALFSSGNRSLPWKRVKWNANLKWVAQTVARPENCHQLYLEGIIAAAKKDPYLL